MYDDPSSLIWTMTRTTSLAGESARGRFSSRCFPSSPPPLPPPPLPMDELAVAEEPSLRFWPRWLPPAVWAAGLTAPAAADGGALSVPAAGCAGDAEDDSWRRAFWACRNWRLLKSLSARCSCSGSSFAFSRVRASRVVWLLSDSKGAVRAQSTYVRIFSSLTCLLTSFRRASRLTSKTVLAGDTKKTWPSPPKSTRTRTLVTGGVSEAESCTAKSSRAGAESVARRSMSTTVTSPRRERSLRKT
mmetsp:Transcript_2354/g.8634  ORF Transcript_2354/g.8634 Transcript_2354/m.8634 type:complete len:245 (-) Transcript_2354:147-881(-)